MPENVAVNRLRITSHLLSEAKSPSTSYPAHRPATIHAQAPDVQHQHLASDVLDDAFDGIGASDQVDTDDAGVEDDDDADNSDDPNAAGRISEASLERIKNGLLQVQKLARGIAAETGLSASQVFDRWMAASQRTHVKRNRWNLYSAYFKDNEEQERARLSERESTLRYSHRCHINTRPHSSSR